MPLVPLDIRRRSRGGHAEGLFTAQATIFACSYALISLPVELAYKISMALVAGISATCRFRRHDREGSRRHRPGADRGDAAAATLAVTPRPRRASSGRDHDAERPSAARRPVQREVQPPRQVRTEVPHALRARGAHGNAHHDWGAREVGPHV